MGIIEGKYRSLYLNLDPLYIWSSHSLSVSPLSNLSLSTDSLRCLGLFCTTHLAALTHDCCRSDVTLIGYVSLSREKKKRPSPSSYLSLRLYCKLLSCVSTALLFWMVLTLSSGRHIKIVSKRVP